MYRTLLIATLIAAAVAYGQVQGGGRGGPQGAPPADAGRGAALPSRAVHKATVNKDTLFITRSLLSYQRTFHVGARCVLVGLTPEL
jgi:hypothetical protein